MRKLEKKEKDLKQQFHELERLIEQTRAKYELYFCGIEKVEPTILRAKIKRIIKAFQKEKQQFKVSERFKLETIIQRFVSLGRYWDRVLLQKERGTYHKDKARLARRKKALATQERPKIGTILNDNNLSIPTERFQELYDEFIQTRQDCNQSIEKVTMEKVAKIVEKQIPLLQNRGYTNIDFKVIIKGGKAALKAYGQKVSDTRQDLPAFPSTYHIEDTQQEIASVSSKVKTDPQLSSKMKTDPQLPSVSDTAAHAAVQVPSHHHEVG